MSPLSTPSKADDDLIDRDIDAYLELYQKKELLRFVAVGSVDDGKSTLIGRLLHDTGMVFEDQLEAVQQASAMGSGEIDFSLFTDGLRAEREQGITIDVAYRYFTTDKRKFIIADTPGHVQYTRNMVTGASTADVALILIDARLGVLQQSRRHAYIASLLGIPHLAVCVNKMDLVGYDQSVFDRIQATFEEFAKDLDIPDITFIPVSALKGVNIVEPSEETAWFKGGSVLEYLESVPLDGVAKDQIKDFRFSVQYVLRPNLNYRGFAGQVSAGEIRPGDEVMALPSGKRSKVRSIDVFEGSLDRAHAAQSVVLRLEDEIDVSRGDMLVQPGALPVVGRSLDAHVVWMSERELDLEKTYLLKHASQTVRVQVEAIQHRIDMDTLSTVLSTKFSLNDIGRLSLVCHRALFFDNYRQNRSTGSFILIDSLTNDTVAAGMIGDATAKESDLSDVLKELRAGSGLKPKTQVSSRERREKMGQDGIAVWLTGLPGSGRWALAYALERRLFDEGKSATVVVPTGEDFRSIISATKACVDAGLVTLCAFPSYRAAEREQVRKRLGKDNFLQVYVNTKEELCRERRPDADFSGFEAPSTPDVTVALDRMTLDEAIESVIDCLDRSTNGKSSG